MINVLAIFMHGPRLRIVIRSFLSETAPRVVIEAKESSRVTFAFVKCPLLSIKSMIQIAEHYAKKYNAEKYICGEYKWKLCRPFLQLLEDTGGLPRALQYVFERCLKGDGKE